MDRIQVAQLGRGERVVGFSAQNPSYFAAGKAAQLLGIVQTQIAAIRQIAGQQEASTGSAQGATEGKDSLVAALRDDIVHIAATFRTLKKHDPKLDVTFVTPERREELTVAAARAFAINAVPLKQDFIDWGMEVDFLEDLNADIAAYDAAAQTQDTRYAGRESDTDDLEVAVQTLVSAIDDLDTLMGNVLRSNVPFLSKWREASHYEKPPRAKRVPPAPTPLAA